MELELRGITKQFPGVLANDDVSLTARSGKVLALIGENGAGKSTLMNVLSGLYHPDAGEIVIDGVVQKFSDPGDAISAGIGMVHQHFMLVPVFSVWENVVLGVEPVTGPGIMNRKEARVEVRDISERYGLSVDPDALVEDLPVGIQQRVEIIKVLLRGAKILVFDEPTAVLTPQEVEEFFGIVAELKGRGATIIFITHKLKEALAIADDITVLRGGKVAGHADPATATPELLASMMVGRDIELVVEKSESEPGQEVLQLHDVHMVDEYGRALLEHGLRGRAEGAGSVDHVVDDYRVAAFDVADDLVRRHLIANVTATMLVDKGDGGVEIAGVLGRQLDPAGIR